MNLEEKYQRIKEYAPVVDDVRVGEQYVYVGNGTYSSKYLYRVTKTIKRKSNISLVLKNCEENLGSWAMTRDLYDIFPFVNVVDIINYSGREYLKELLREKAYDSIITGTNPCAEVPLGEVNSYHDEAKQKFNQLEQESKMKNIKTQVTANNISAAKVAAQLTAGDVINTTIMAKVRPQLPMMVRGYSDHVLAKVVVANVASFAVDNFASNNEKAKWAADAMMVAAMTELMKSFNVEQIVADVLEGVNIPDLDEVTDKE